jgi:hypothetical protein
LQETSRQSYAQMDEARERLLELLHHLLHRVSYKKRTELAVDIVRQLAHEGHFPQAQYAFDHGLLALELTRCIPTVSLDVIALVANSCGYYRRQIEYCAAQ